MDGLALLVLWDKCSHSVWKTQSGRQCGEFHQPSHIAGGQDLFELRLHSLVSVGLNILESVFEQASDPVRRPMLTEAAGSEVLFPVKSSGVCLEASVLMGGCSVLQRGRLHYWSCFTELLSCVKWSWQYPTALTLNLLAPPHQGPCSLSLFPFLVHKRGSLYKAHFCPRATHYQYCSACSSCSLLPLDSDQMQSQSCAGCHQSPSWVRRE